MLRSLYSGVSGMKSNQTKMDVIGNNISNVNSTAFKSGRVTFKDMLSQTVQGATNPQDGKGGMNPKQIGVGVGVASIDTNMSQGALQPTGRATDLAIEGNGFFVISDGTELRYTRDGGLTIDENGNLLNADGYHLMGLKLNSAGNRIDQDNTLIIGDVHAKSDLEMNGKALTSLENLLIPIQADITKKFYQIKDANNFGGFNIKFSEGDALAGWTIKTGQVGDGVGTGVVVDSKSKIITVNGDFTKNFKNVLDNITVAPSLGLNKTNITDADLGSGLSAGQYKVVVKAYNPSAEVISDAGKTTMSPLPSILNGTSFTGDRNQTVQFKIGEVGSSGEATKVLYSADGGNTWLEDKVTIKSSANGNTVINYEGVDIKMEEPLAKDEIATVQFNARYNGFILQDANGKDIQTNQITGITSTTSDPIEFGSIKDGLGSGLSGDYKIDVTSKTDSKVDPVADTTGGKVTITGDQKLYNGGKDEDVIFKLSKVTNGKADEIEYSNDGGLNWQKATINTAGADTIITYKGVDLTLKTDTKNAAEQTATFKFSAKYNEISLSKGGTTIGSSQKAYPIDNYIVIGDEKTGETVKIASSKFGNYSIGDTDITISKKTIEVPAYPKDSNVVFGDPATGQTVKINASNFGDLGYGEATITVGKEEIGMLEASELEKEINSALKDARIAQTVKVSGQAVNGTTSASQKLDMVQEASAVAVGGLTFKFSDGDELNGWTVKIGQASNGTPTSAELDGANKIITINGDFDDTTAKGMILSKDIEDKINKLLDDSGINQTVAVSGNAKTGTKSGETSAAINMSSRNLIKLTSFGVDKDGTINAVYGDQTITVGKIAMAAFQNAAGLTKNGGNTYTQSLNSGEPMIGDAASLGYGNIQQGNLEMSNVDLASEFTDMIVTSRAFQANSRTITTSDEMLQELLNLKR